MLERMRTAKFILAAFVGLLLSLPALSSSSPSVTQPAVLPGYFPADALDSYEDLAQLKTAYEKLNTTAVRRLAVMAHQNLPFNTASVLFTLSLKYLRSAKLSKAVSKEIRAITKDQPSVVSVKGGLKKWETVVEKAFLREKPKGDKISDLLRFKIIFDDSGYDEMIAFARWFEDKYSVHSFQNRFEKPQESGYRDINLRFIHQGVVVELILNLQSIDSIAKKERAEVYEKTRMGQEVDIERKAFYKQSYNFAASFAR